MPYATPRTSFDTVPPNAVAFGLTRTKPSLNEASSMSPVIAPAGSDRSLVIRLRPSTTSRPESIISADSFLMVASSKYIEFLSSEK